MMKHSNIIHTFMDSPEEGLDYVESSLRNSIINEELIEKEMHFRITFSNGSIIKIFYGYLNEKGFYCQYIDGVFVEIVKTRHPYKNFRKLISKDRLINLLIKIGA